MPSKLCPGIVDSSSHAFYSGIVWTLSDTTLAKVLNYSGSYGGPGGPVTVFGVITTFAPGIDTMTLTIPGPGGCPGTLRKTLLVLDSPDYVINSVLTPIKCYGTNIGEVNINLTPDTAGRSIGPKFNYTWSNGVSTLGAGTADLLDSLYAGTYYLTLMEISSHCVRNDSFVFTQPDRLDVIPTIKNDTCKTGNGALWVSIAGGVPPYTWSWNTGSTDTFMLGLAEGTYTFTTTDQNQCVRDTALLVDEGVCDDIVVFNALTPNGDGVNDVWVIKGIQDYPNNSVEIFDKWGDLVYKKDHYLNDWDARGLSGDILPAGTYFYIVKLNTVNASGGSNVKTGSILIKR